MQVPGSLAPLQSASNGFAITPDDANTLETAALALYVGVSGDVKVALLGGAVVTLKALAAGIVHPIAVQRVFATGTTATNIVGLF